MGEHTVLLLSRPYFLDGAGAQDSDHERSTYVAFSAASIVLHYLVSDRVLRADAGD